MIEQMACLSINITSPPTGRVDYSLQAAFLGARLVTNKRQQTNRVVKIFVEVHIQRNKRQCISKGVVDPEEEGCLLDC